MSSRSCFFYGALGSVLPEVVKYYQLAIKLRLPAPSRAEVWAFYVAMSLVFMGASGWFTTAWQPRNRLQAIWVGISFPTIVGTLLQVAPTMPR